MNNWAHVIYVFVGIPVAFVIIYLLVRIITVACLHSWWDTKLWYLKKLRKEQEEQNGGR